MNEAFETAFQQARERLKIKGFRKGMVPEHLARRHLTDEKLAKRVKRLLARPAVERAVARSHHTLLAEPRVKLGTLSRDRDLALKAVCRVVPRLKIQRVSPEPVDRSRIEISEAAVEQILAERRRGLARYRDVPPEQELQRGDIAVLSYEIKTLQGEKLENRVEDFLLEMREEKFLPGFVSAIVGMRRGERRSFKLRLPSDYPRELYREREVEFQVHLRGVKQMVLPKLDDNFAKRHGLAPDLRQLREKLRGRLLERAAGQIQNKLVTRALGKMLQQVPEEGIPEELIAKHVRLGGVEFEKNRNLAILEARLEILYRSLAYEFKIVEKDYARLVTRVRESLRGEALVQAPEDKAPGR